MLRIVFVTQLVDPEDPVLGFAVKQVEALSRVADVTVIANEVRGDSGLGCTVVSLGKESGHGTVRRGAAYEAALWRAFAGGRTDVLVAHMCPIYLNLAAPLLRAFRVGSLLWFLHPSDTRMLRVAEAVSDRVITSFPGSFPHAGPKVVPIGHAIDVDAFDVGPSSRPPGTPLRLLAMGRTSPIKHYDDIVAAVVAAHRRGAHVELRIVGPSTTPEEARHRRELELLVPPDLRDRIRIDAPIARSHVASAFAESHVVVNATGHGSADKVVFEAMAARRPVLASSRAFAPLLDAVPADLAFPDGDVRVLADRLVELARMPTPEMQELGSRLRGLVVAGHSLAHWADRVVDLGAQVSRGPRGMLARGPGASST